MELYAGTLTGQRRDARCSSAGPDLSLPEVAGLVTLSQLIQKVLEIGRYSRRIRTKRLLEAITHSLTNRPAGLAIDRFDRVGAVVLHDGSASRMMVSHRPTKHQVATGPICFRQPADSALSRWTTPGTYAALRPGERKPRPERPGLGRGYIGS